MAKKLRITTGTITVEAELNESETAGLVWDILPLSDHASLWGEEIYFTIPLETGPENAREVVEMGDVAYWSPGKALCIFFGKTPSSRGKEIRPYSPVNVIGRLTGDPKALRRVKEGDSIAVSRANE